ncbi:MAG: pectate lyase [Lewinella sp.]
MHHLPAASLFLLLLLGGCNATNHQPHRNDPVAENMLLYQLDHGGWPQDHGDDVAYEKELSTVERATVIKNKAKMRGTIDDQSTTREIVYLLEANGQKANASYLAAAKKGLRFLLSAQGVAGGWPQEYPNPESYHQHITYNDNAMIDVLHVMKETAEGKGVYAVLDQELKKEAAAAVRRGIDCILRTQFVSRSGQLTVWCAQHDSQTLQPASARKFEPASLSGSESVEIIRFLMEIEQPSEAVKAAVRAGVAWFDQVRIDGYRLKAIKDAKQPKGEDRVLLPKPGHTCWARFYELDTYRPVFTGRDGIVRYDLREIENERRVGYRFYGDWAEELVDEELDHWESRIK